MSAIDLPNEIALMSKTASREIRLASQPKGIPTADNLTMAKIMKTAAAAKACSLRSDHNRKRTMKQVPPETEKDHGKDLKAFEQLPAKTKELELLQHQAEQSTGQESVVLHKMIREKSQQGNPEPVIGINADSTPKS